MSDRFKELLKGTSNTRDLAMRTITIELTDRALAEVRQLADHYKDAGCGPDGPLDDPLGHAIEIAIMEAARTRAIEVGTEDEYWKAQGCG